MNDRTTHVNTWHQLSMLPPASRTITLTIALDPEMDYAHYDVEVVDNGSGNTVALHVMPMRSSTTWQLDLQLIIDRLHDAIGKLVEPF